MRVLILGTAPGFNEVDPSQYDEVFGLNAHVGAVKLTRCFEIHNIDMLAYTGDVGAYLAKPHAGLGSAFYVHPSLLGICPNATAFNYQDKLEKYGPFFTNSVSWMIAEAIDVGATHITIAGVNMQNDEEYGHQKPSCWYMLGCARMLGITVDTPKANTLLRVAYQYGYESPPAVRDVFERRKAHTEKLIADYKNKIEADQKAAEYYRGCVDTLDFMMKSAGMK